MESVHHITVRAPVNNEPLRLGEAKVVLKSFFGPVTVREVYGPDRAVPSLCGVYSRPKGDESPAGKGEAKTRLAHTLRSEAIRRRNGAQTAPGVDACDDRIRLMRTRLGKPYALIGDRPGPALSFSHVPGATWAALCEDCDCEIGIDAASAKEFEEGYPFERAFRSVELDDAIEKLGRPRAEAAAFVWSVKEATVKALGCGFHTVDPFDVRVFAVSAVPEGGLVVTSRSDTPFGRSGDREHRPTQAVSFRHAGVWISVARTLPAAAPWS